MKSFLVGLIFVIAVVIVGFVLVGMVHLLIPFIIVLALFWRLALLIILGILAVWCLGKFIIFIWEALRGK